MRERANFRQVLRNIRFQQSLIVAFTILVFWHGIWAGAPRADQVSYLHQVSQYQTLTEILRHAPDWNRTHSAAGDDVLYRPVLYLLLGLEFFFFRYNFALWQLAGIALHALVALTLFAILRKTGLENTIWPLLMTCFFAGSYLPSELVIWNHLTGYVLFVLLLALSLNALLSFVSLRTPWPLAVHFASSIAATLTHELGAVYSLVAGMTLFAVHAKTGDPVRRRWILWAGALTLALPVPYIFASRWNTASLKVPALSLADVSTATTDTLLQLTAWAMGLFSPTSFKVVPDSRALITELSFGNRPLDLANYAALLLLAGGVAVSAWVIRRSDLATSAVRATPVLTFLVLYSVAIATGRSLQKGIAYTLRENLYYSYIPAFAVCVGFAFFAGTAIHRLGAAREKAPFARPVGKGLIAIGFAVLVGLNAWGTYNLCKGYRIGYSSMRLGIIEEVAKWHQRPERSPTEFFQVNFPCVDDLPWFGPHVRKGSKWNGPFMMPDVLFPEGSFALNKPSSNTTNVRTTTIPCAVQDLLDLRVLEGRWELGAMIPEVEIRVVGNRLSLVNEFGSEATGTVRHGQIEVVKWGLIGQVILTSDSAIIRWNHASTWYRSVRHSALVRM